MLSERQERSLAAIEHWLRLSDGRLAYRFSLFAELVGDEEMPRREQLPVTIRARLERLRRFIALPARDAGAGPRAQALLLVPVLLVAITCTVLLVIAPSHGSAGCTVRTGPEMVADGPRASEQPAGWPSSCAAKQRPPHR